MTTDNVVYHFCEASIPPPYHFEYSITLKDDDSGVIDFRPDYPQQDVPFWSMRFQISRTKFDELMSIFSTLPTGQEWRIPERIRTGGSQEWCEGIISGRRFQIPAELDENDARLWQDVYSNIKQLVPLAIWKELNDKRDRYIQTYSP